MESIRLSGPSAVVSAVPYLLGFRPERSLVLLLSGAASGRVELTLRVDLPTGADPLAAFVGDVLARTRQVQADRVVAVVFDHVDVDAGSPRGPHPELIDELEAQLACQGRTLVDALFVADDRWWSYQCSNPNCCPAQGNPIHDPDGTAAAAEAVGRGLAVAPSRAEFGAALVPSLPELAVQVHHELEVLPCPEFGQPGWTAWRDRSESEFLRACAGGESLGSWSAPLLARLLLALADFRVRDPLLWHLAHESTGAEGAPQLLAALAAVAPGELAAPPRTMLAVCHWQQGNGAAAATLLSDVPADYSLARLLRRALDVGLPPGRWLEMLRGLDLAGCRNGVAA